MADEFKVHRLTPDGLVRADNIARAFETLLSTLDNCGITGRPRSLAVTKLQEACFWAKRGLAEMPENQLDPK